MTVEEFADEHPIAFAIVGWSTMIVFGPMLFRDIVGPMGGTDWRQWVCAFAGCVLWGVVILCVFSFSWATW